MESVYPLLNIDHYELVARTNSYETLLDELKKEVQVLRRADIPFASDLIDGPDREND